MAECPSGRTIKGTRSQFRLGTSGLGQFEGLHPIHLGDVMDIGQSSQTGVLSPSDFVSPTKGTRTRTVREYEQTISELKKENFDLKLRVFLFEEAMNKNSRKDKECCSPDKDNTVQVIVQLKLETESLRNELSYKDKLLQDAMEHADKCSLDFKQLEKQYAELQSELASLSELPSKQEFKLLLDEKETLLKHNETLEKNLLAKNEEIDDLNQKIEILSNQNSELEEKIKKRSLAIQGFIYKNYKEKEMLPDELRNVVITAIQAAKNQKKDDLLIATKNFNSALNQIMLSTASVSVSEEKEHVKSPETKCLKEEHVEKSSIVLPNQIESCSELNYIQSLKEVLSKRNTAMTGQMSNLDTTIDNSCRSGQAQNEVSINVAEKDVMDFTSLSSVPLTIPKEENLISFSTVPRNQSCSLHEDVAIETITPSSISSHQIESFSKEGFNLLSDNSKQQADLIQLLKENEVLKLALNEKLAVIQTLKSTWNKLEPNTDQLKISEYSTVQTQTNIAGCDLLQVYETAKMKKFSKLSDNIEELREDVELLLFTIEDKNKELVDVKQTLSAVQADLKKTSNMSYLLDKDYMNERNELHERLAISCSVNVELMEHLRSLEAFMEDLLQHKLDSSMESISERSDFFSNVSKCLNESLKLSHALSDHLSICEGSKLFEECESVLYTNASYVNDRSFPGLNALEMDIPLDQSTSPHRTQNHEEYFSSITKEKEQKVANMACDPLSLNSHQLCRRCWQLVNPSLNKPDMPSPHQSNIIASKPMGYLSSDSDIWSEPDRDVSMQRIGISLQNSPVTSKSPRKLRLKDKRTSSKLSSEQDTSSTEINLKHWSKQRRNGSAARHLFARECGKNQDFIVEKYYFILAEKFFKLKSLINTLEKVENLKNGKVSDEIKNKLNSLVACVGEALQKLQVAKEKIKSISSSVCGKCIVFELLANLRSYQSDLHIQETFVGCEIFQQIMNEIHLLIEECKEPFYAFFTSISKASKSIQCLLLPEMQQSEVNKLEQIIADLNYKNRNLNESLNDVKELLNKEKEMLTSVKTKNIELSSHVSHLKAELLSMKQKEQELLLKNAELLEKITHASNTNSELNSILKDLEQKRRESNIAFDQLTTELQKNKLDLINMNAKCIEYEKELSQKDKMKEECEEKFKNLELSALNERKGYLHQIEDLNMEKNSFMQKLNKVQEEVHSLKKENILLNDNLNAKSSELISLLEKLETLQNAKDELNSDYSELQTEYKNLKQQLMNIQEKYHANEEYYKHWRNLEEESLCEKKRLNEQISVLTSERDEILQNLNEEREHSKRLMAEKLKLNQNFIESSQQISSLKLLNDKLENTQLSLVKKNESIENALLSSNSNCDLLGNDLKHLRETLQKLELKCSNYEKELIASAGMKDNLIECLLNINNELSFNRQKLNEMCKAYDNEMYQVQDETEMSDIIPIIDEDNVKQLCENLCVESKKLLQAVNTLLEMLKKFYLKSQEIKSIEDRYEIKAKSLNKQMEMYKLEAERLKSQNDHFQKTIDELQKSVSGNEKSVQITAFEIHSLKEKLQNADNEIEKGKQLLRVKEEEITMLQERIFNLQTYVSSIISENAVLHNKASLGGGQKHDVKEKMDSVSKDSLPHSLSVPEMPYGSEYEDLGQSADDSFKSTSTPEVAKCSYCEKYWKKYHSLQTKLALCRKRIEILEKEKNDLRENFLQKLQIKTDSDEPENKESINVKLKDLEFKLEQKKGFINDLKGELLKTCNSLIDKEKEVDDLKQKLAECEIKIKHTQSGLSEQHLDVDHKAVSTNIRNLRNHKWELIQAIFDIQRKFYENRGIHLNYFDKFRNHVNSLYSYQLMYPLSKSESLPVLWSHAFKETQWQVNDRLKNLVGLELDIECLENMKIFLNRFVIPSTSQGSQITDLQPSLSPIFKKEKGNISPGKLLLEAVSEKSEASKLENAQFLQISQPDYCCDDGPPHFKDIILGKYDSLEKIASDISSHLNYIEKFFRRVKECQQLKSLDIYGEESNEKKTEIKLLLKIFHEIKMLYETANKLFSLNERLKDSFPISPRKVDGSDKESLLSEEPIVVSRTESPISLEEFYPVKLPCPETLMLEKILIQPESSESKGLRNEPYSIKVMAVDSSYDSVCARSHFSSPDLGIESDPNHESSAPEQKDDKISQYEMLILEEQKIILKPPPKTAFTSAESASKWKGKKFGGVLYSIGNLPHYELLKREIQESLVGIKSVLSRTGDGLHHVIKYTSPRKTLEYSTLKAIKDSCANIEVCLKEAYKLIGKFWIAPCPSEKEWKTLIDENEILHGELINLKALKQKQENEFKKALRKLEHAKKVTANMEKKISKKLVSTKKIIRQSEVKVLENRCQNIPPLPKYLSLQPSSSNPVQNA